MTDQFPAQPGGSGPNPGQPQYGPPGPWQGPPPGDPPQYGPPPQQQPPQYGQQQPTYNGPPPQYGQQPQYGPPPQYGQQQPIYNGPPPMAPGGPVPPGQDYLSGLNAPPRRRRRGLIIASAAVVVALGVSGGAYAILAGNQSGKGKADVAAKYIPRDSIAAMSANLSPGGSETVEVLKFFRKFPAIASRSTGSTISDGLIKPLFDDARGVDYNTDIKPWLGSHISMAAEPQNGSIHPVAAIEVTNEDKAKTALTKYLRGQSDVGWVFHDGYAIISDSTSHAQYAASHIGGSGLKGAGNYSSDIKDVPSDSVLNAWVDIKAGLRYGQSQGMMPKLPMANLPDRMAIGLRFENSTADLIYRTIGGKVTNSKTLMGPKVGALPNDTSFAMGITDGNTILANSWPSLAQFINETNPYVLQNFQDRTGLSLPGDLETLAGSRTIVAVGSDTNKVGFESTTNDPDKAVQVASKLNEGSDQPAVVRKTNDGVLVASTQDWANALQQGGSLGQQDAFKRAVPDAAKANIVMYGDITKLAGSQAERLPADAQVFKAFGLTVTADSSGATAHLRLVLK
jgi:hypothetical protein